MDYPKADLKEKEAAQEFLKDHPMAVLSTVSEDGKPWGAAIYAVSDDEFNFFFITREKTHKFKNIDKNNKVALTFANPETQETVQVSGSVDNVPSHDIVEVVFKKLASVKPRDDDNWSPPMIKVHKGDWMVLQVTPDYAQYANFSVQKTHPEDTYIRALV